MKIELEHIGRRFNREWIFRNLSYTFDSGGSHAILGHNGAGKSTLLQIISGSLTPSEGTLQFYSEGKSIDAEKVYRELSIAAPYLELIEEFSLTELIDFHSHFKHWRDGLNTRDIVSILGFEKSRNKALKYFSSGMKQRTKLALAFCSDTPLLLLDEPTANLDSQGINWYKEFIARYSSQRTVIICSNQEHEYDFCQSVLDIISYK